MKEIERIYPVAHRVLKKVANPHNAYQEAANLLTERCGFRSSDLKEIRYEHDRSVKPEQITRVLRAEKSQNSIKIRIDCRFKIAAKQLRKKSDKFEELESIGNLEYWIKGMVRGKLKKGIIQQISEWFGKSKEDKFEKSLKLARKTTKKLDLSLRAYFKAL